MQTLFGVATAVAVISFFPGSVMAASGLAFLKIGAGPRVVAMGGAAVGSVIDASAVYWNPARMSETPGTNIMLAHTQWLQGISHEFAGITFHSGNNTLGAGFVLMTVDGIERRGDIPTRLPVATFNAYDVMASLSYARKMGAGISAGVTVKGISEKILFHSASTFAFDAGLSYVHGSGLSAGGSVRNIGSDAMFIRDKVSLPSEFRLGVAFAPVTLLPGKRIVAAMDIGKYRGETTRLYAGVSYTLGDRLTAMTGYRAGGGDAGASAGLGIGFRRWRIDYAFAPMRAGLGHTHRFAASIAL